MTKKSKNKFKKKPDLHESKELKSQRKMKVKRPGRENWWMKIATKLQGKQIVIIEEYNQNKNGLNIREKSFLTTI